ncbi:hypothetical protein ACHAWF_000959 [Thalassiosira exigua]
MPVNNMSFVVTKSRKIIFYTAKHCLNPRPSDLSSAISKVVNLYARGDFTLRAVLLDMKFKKLVDRVPLLEINTTAARGRVDTWVTSSGVYQSN